MRYWATSVALGALVVGLRAQTAEPFVSVLPARPNIWNYSGLYSVSGNQTALKNWNAGGIQWKQLLGVGLSYPLGAQKI